MRKCVEVNPSLNAYFYQNSAPALTPHPFVHPLKVICPNAREVRSAFRPEDGPITQDLIAKLFSIVRGKTLSGLGLKDHYTNNIITIMHAGKPVLDEHIDSELTLLWLVQQFALHYPEEKRALFAMLSRSAIDGLSLAIELNRELFVIALQNNTREVARRIAAMQNGSSARFIGRHNTEGSVYEVHCSGPGLAMKIMRTGGDIAEQIVDILSKNSHRQPILSRREPSNREIRRGYIRRLSTVLQDS